MEAILASIGGLFSGFSNIVVSNQQAKYGRLPDWLSSRDFQRKDYTIELLIGGMVLVLVVIIVAMAVVGVRKSK